MVNPSTSIPSANKRLPMLTCSEGVVSFPDASLQGFAEVENARVASISVIAENGSVMYTPGAVG